MLQYVRSIIGKTTRIENRSEQQDVITEHCSSCNDYLNQTGRFIGYIQGCLSTGFLANIEFNPFQPTYLASTDTNRWMSSNM